LKFARGLAEFSELEIVHEAAVQFVTETRVPAGPVPSPRAVDSSARPQRANAAP
jgi:hypothetical protein